MYTRIPRTPEVESTVEDTRLEAKAKDTKTSRPRPRTDPLEAKTKDQGPKKKRSSKIYFRRKRSSKIFFQAIFTKRKPKKRSLPFFCEVSGVFQRNFNGSKIVLSSCRGQGDFRGFEASRPRPRTSKCVLEDVLQAKDVLADSTSGVHYLILILNSSSTRQ